MCKITRDAAFIVLRFQSFSILAPGLKTAIFRYFYQAELDGLAHSPGDKTPDFGPNGVSVKKTRHPPHASFEFPGGCIYFSRLLVNRGSLRATASTPKTTKRLVSECIAGSRAPGSWCSRP